MTDSALQKEGKSHRRDGSAQLMQSRRERGERGERAECGWEERGGDEAAMARRGLTLPSEEETSQRLKQTQEEGRVLHGEEDGGRGEFREKKGMERVGGRMESGGEQDGPPPLRFLAKTRRWRTHCRPVAANAEDTEDPTHAQHHDRRGDEGNSQGFEEGAGQPGASADNDLARPPSR